MYGASEEGMSSLCSVLDGDWAFVLYDAAKDLCVRHLCVLPGRTAAEFAAALQIRCCSRPHWRQPYVRLPTLGSHHE